MAAYVKLFPFKVRTASAESDRVTVWDKYQAAHIVIDHANVGGGLTVGVFGVVPGDNGSPDFQYSLASTAIIASGHTVIKIGPDYTAATNVIKDYMPYYFKVAVTASGTNAYGINASLI